MRSHKMALLLMMFAAAVLLISSIQSIEGELLKCPTISNGYRPFCECRYGPKYDEATNTCPNPECPTYNSTGLYPNCTCSHKNFEYSIYLNECVRVCPEDSNGYWPNCNCDADGYVFNKIQFKCIACPLDSTIIYSKCMCSKDRVYDECSNSCMRPEGPKNCPLDSILVYPYCNCVQNGLQCPLDSVGIYPNCTCERNGAYINNLNSCYRCPDESIGKYPNCSCPHSLQYENDKNKCVKCPENTSGIYPNCTCTNGYFSQYHESCMECPENSTGFYPECQCLEEDHEFSAFINECYIPCPQNSFGKHPYCRCDEIDNYYVVNEFICKSNIGRKCPLDSIGVGPDCLCLLKEHRFFSPNWQCIHKSTTFHRNSYWPITCGEGYSGKWPQCEKSIESKALISLID